MFFLPGADVYKRQDVEGSLLDEAFQERLEELPEINGEEKAAYIEKNRELLKDHFVPAYEKLAEGLEALKGSGSNEMCIRDRACILAVGAVENRLQIIRGKSCVAQQLSFVAGELMEPLFQFGQGIKIAIEHLFSLCDR